MPYMLCLLIRIFRGNAQGVISLQRLDEAFGLNQRYLLMQEGVIFNNNGSINLTLYKWS